MTHYYKGYELRRNGTRAYPWNIYKQRVNPYSKDKNGALFHVGFDRTLKACKVAIDAGCYDAD